MAAKTSTDPVEDARHALDQAQRAEDEAQAKLDSFRDRILGSDTTVSAEDYGNAAHELERAQLLTQAAAAALQRTEQAERLRRLAALSDDVREKAGTPAGALDAMARIEQAVAELVASAAGRQQLIARTTAAMRKEGVPALTPGDELTAEHAHLGWKIAGMGYGDTVYAGDRAISDVNVGRLIGAAIDRGCRTAGRSVHWLRPVLEVNSTGDLAQDPAAWLAHHY